jgi:hypothetical protein
MSEFELGTIDEENLWLDRLNDVVNNDPDATQNWYIPLQLLDFVGFHVEEIQEWATSAEMSRDENRNAIVNSVVSQWIEGRIANNEQRKAAFSFALMN